MKRAFTALKSNFAHVAAAHTHTNTHTHTQINTQIIHKQKLSSAMCSFDYEGQRIT